MEPALTGRRGARIELYTRAVAGALDAVPLERQHAFGRAILNARHIVLAGRGRSGMIAAAFSRRLGQMGLHAWNLEDSTVPRLGADDVLVACTGSGETPTVISLMDTAQKGGAAVLVVTRAPSRLDAEADIVVELAVPLGGTDYPLGTLFEASLLAFLDLVVVDLLEALGETESELGARHTNLE